MAEALVSKILFVLLKLFLWLIDKLSQLFMVFSGLRSVQYNGENNTILQVFFGSKAINTVYWGMALIGIALCFGFAIFAVTRKMFDANGKVQSSLGQILTDMLKSIIIILSMSAILNLTITGTDVLMRQINALFNEAYGSSKDYTVEFTDDQLSAMGRVLLTVANYGENPSYRSRYNLNACFNEIRPDLLYLKNQGVLDYDYPLHEYTGAAITGDVNTWQNVCQRLGNAADLRYELPADDYNEHVAKAIEETLRIMDTDASFKPLKSFTVKGSGVSSSDAPFDRIIFLTAGLDAANNKQFNGGNANLTDSLRRPWYNGTKSLYDMEYEVNGRLVEWDSNDEIDNDFDTGFTKYNYLIAFVLCIATTLSLLTILLNLGGRIFNLLVLYVIAPPALATAPLDGGGKTKQWTISFIIQVLSVFGSVIAMRLLLVFVPVIYDPELLFFPDNAILNFIAKAALLLAAFAGSMKASTLINGILSDTAGMASAQAADFSGTAAKLLGVGGSLARTVGGKAMGIAGFAASPLTNQFKKLTSAYRGLGSGPLTKAGKDKQLMDQAKQRLAADQAYEKLRAESGGVSGGGMSLPGKSTAEAPQKADAAYSAPDTGSSAPSDFAATRKSATIEGRVKGLEAQMGSDSGGIPVASEIEAPEGGNIPEAPPMPQQSPDAGGGSGNVARRTAQLERGRAMARAGAKGGSVQRPVAAKGGNVPKAPTMRNATGQSMRPKIDPEKARRQAAMNTASTAGMRIGSVSQRAARMQMAQSQASKQAESMPKPEVKPNKGGFVPLTPIIADGATIQNRVFGLEAQRDRMNEQLPQVPDTQTVVSGTGPNIPEAPKTPQMRQREMDDYTVNQFLRNRWNERDEQ